MRYIKVTNASIFKAIIIKETLLYLLIFRMRNVNSNLKKVFSIPLLSKTQVLSTNLPMSYNSIIKISRSFHQRKNEQLKRK